jgi:uncharacterized protein DUF1501
MYRVLGPGARRTCQGVSRRELLQVGSAGFLGLSLTDLFRLQAAQASSAAPPNVGGAGGQDVNCILLFLWGGPPQHELWDPKPDAPTDIAGLFKPISTNVDGIRIGEHLPRMATIADQYVLIRSAHHDSDVHGNGAHYNQTGMAKLPNIENPNMGAVVDRFKGPRGALPAFVTVGPYMQDAPVPNTGQEGGFLGSSHQPFRILDPLAPVEKQPSLALPDGISLDRLRRRDRLHRSIDLFQRRVETGSTRGYDTAFERAVSLTTSPQAKAAFDLAQEPDPVRDRYGRDAFGQGCLLARRLVEAGVRFVQVNWAEKPNEKFGFDNHGDNFNQLKDRQLPRLDRACSALIEDLVQRGLYERTLLLVTGEFGRTPKINSSAGRDHWPYVYSYLIGGAGIPGGRVIGSSDAQGAYPDTTPVTPAMCAASVFSLLGLDVNLKLRTENLISDARGIPGLFGE